MRISLTILALAALGAGRLSAQNATPSDLRQAYLADMKEVETKIVGLAEAFPADKYSWRPGPGVRSVSEVLMHIASEHYGYLPMSLGKQPPASLKMGTGQEFFSNIEKVTDKAAVIEHLKAAFDYQRTVLMGADAILNKGTVKAFGQDYSIAGFFNLYIADQHEHLGQLIAYARVNGIVPPWSKKS